MALMVHHIISCHIVLCPDAPAPAAADPERADAALPPPRDPPLCCSTTIKRGLGERRDDAEGYRQICAYISTQSSGSAIYPANIYIYIYIYIYI